MGFNGSECDSKQEKYGVLQGSSQGPLLYSIFTNDFPLIKNALISMFACESTIYLAETIMVDLNMKLGPKKR